MDYRPLEITVISASDLKCVNRFSKMDVYAVVTVSSDRRNRQKTPVDKDCGSNPKWNYAMKFDIDEAAAKQNRLTLTFQLVSDRNLGDREIGEVNVPIKELLDHNNDNAKVEQMVSYSVRLPQGKSKGTINFSYKFGEKYIKPAAAPPTPITAAPVMAYPPSHPGSGSMYPPPGSYPPHGSYPPPGGYYPPFGAYQGPPSPGAYPAPPSPGAHSSPLSQKMEAGHEKGQHHPYPTPGGYPGSTSSGTAVGHEKGHNQPYPPPGGYPPQLHAYGGYPSPSPHGHGGYPPAAMAAATGGGYGYPGYPKRQKPQKAKKSKMGMGLGLGVAGLGAGLLGGMMVGYAVGDVVEDASNIMPDADALVADAVFDDGLGSALF